MLSKIIIFPLVLLIRVYQIILSPLFGVNCRFMPTCSEYILGSFKSHGLVKGFLLSFKRIGKCHPWGSNGYDPIPTKLRKNKYE